VFFDLTDLRVFVLAAETGSLTAAAQRAHLALAAVSKRVQHLEEQAGTQLFAREQKGVRVTRAGRVFLDHARAILNQTEVMRAELLEYGSGLRGLVRLVANSNATLEYLPEILGRYLASHPLVDVQLQELTSIDVVKAVAEARADVGVFAATVDPRPLTTFPLCDDRLVVVAPAHHPLARRATVAFWEILGEDLISLDDHAAIHIVLQEQASQLGRAIRVRVQVRGFDGVCRFAQAGVGIGVTPESSARRHAQAGALAMIPLEDPWALRSLRICVRDVAALPAYAQELVQELKTCSSRQNGS
jgi:DNA-binding transcriptional LysR family regulator